MQNQYAETNLTGQSVIVTNENLRPPKLRIDSIDILRGTVMLIMALFREEYLLNQFLVWAGAN